MPDLVSKLREALRALLPHARAYIEQAILAGATGEAEKQALTRVQNAEALLIAVDKQSAESLLGREGQAAETIIEIDEEGKVHGDISGLRAPCGPSQPEPLEFHKPGQIPVNTPMCDKCGKMFLECQCSQEAPSPSTPIHPETGTEKALNYANELIEDFLVNEECGCARGLYPRPCARCRVTIEQAREYIAAATVPSNQPPSTPIVPSTAGLSAEMLQKRNELRGREAQIRKDALEETAQHVPMSYRQGFDRFWIECTCGWNKDGVIATGVLPNPTLWANHIRALAERPAPAGEVSKVKNGKS